MNFISNLDLVQNIYLDSKSTYVNDYKSLFAQLQHIGKQFKLKNTPT